MNSFIAVLLLACIASVASQLTSYSGQTYSAGAEIAARVSGDIQNVTGYTRVRTDGDSLYFESALNNAVQITGVHLHLTPQRGVVDGGPLVLALTNTSVAAGAQPLSANGSQPLVQIGNVSSTALATNPQIQQARAGIVALGINDNTLQNVGDIDRLYRAGVIYSDVHSVDRVSPNRVGSGLLVLFAASPGSGPVSAQGPIPGRKML